MATPATSRKNGHAEVMSGATFKPAKTNTEQAARNAARMHVINERRVKVEKKNGKWGCWVWPGKTNPKKVKNWSLFGGGSKGAKELPSGDKIVQFDESRWSDVRQLLREPHRSGSYSDYKRKHPGQMWMLYRHGDFIKALPSKRKLEAYARRYNPRKRNPESGAVAMREAFTGIPSKKTIVVGENLHYHSHLAALGELVALKVKTIKGDTFEIGFTKEQNPKKHKSALGKVKGWIDRRGKAVSRLLKGQQDMWINPRVKNPSGPVLLCATEDGKQLYIEGGDQSIDLKGLGLGDFASKESVIVGEIKTIDYFATKDWKDGKKPETAIYTHKFNEDTGGPRPMLRYDTRNEHCYIDGGLYKINKPLFGGTSPGLEN